MIDKSAGGPTFSVVICTLNRPDVLDLCLTALVDRTVEKPDHVIVVNGGSDESDRIVARYMARQDVEVKLVKTVNENLAVSRNIALSYCTGDLVGMTDDDAEVFPDWVSQMKRVHREYPEAAGVGGPVFKTGKDSLVSRVSDEVTFRRYTGAKRVRTLPGVNVSYKREAIEAVGPQDEALFRGEDVDYNWRLVGMGYDLIYDPAVKVLHHHRSTLRSFVGQHYMYGKGYYIVRRKWPEMYCMYPHQLKVPKDFLKAANFLAATIYEPLIYAPRAGGLRRRALSVGVLLMNAVAWRWGMAHQWWKDRGRAEMGRE